MRTSSAANFSTAVNGAASGTLNLQHNDNFHNEAQTILNDDLSAVPASACCDAAE